MSIRTKVCLSSFAAAAALGIASPSFAATTVLTFDGLACTGTNGGSVDRNCVDSGNFIGANYGSTAQLGISYNAADVSSVGGVEIISLQYSSYGSSFPGGAASAIVPVGTGTETYSRIFFNPAAGYEVSLRSFEYSNQSSNVLIFLADILDSNNNIIFSYASPQGVGSDFVMVAPNTTYSTGPLTFRFQSPSGNAGIDNFTFDIRAVGTPGVVPEPTAWAMMIFGFGAVGCAMRRRRMQQAFAVA